jgi:hypothetical protein
MFKKEKTIHEFAEDPSIKKLLDGGFLKIDESQYEYNRNCYCKKCKEYRIANSYGGYSYSNINR